MERGAGCELSCYLPAQHCCGSDGASLNVKHLSSSSHQTSPLSPIHPNNHSLMLFLTKFLNTHKLILIHSPITQDVSHFHTSLFWCLTPILPFPYKFLHRFICSKPPSSWFPREMRKHIFFTWPPLNWETFPHNFDWNFLVILQIDLIDFKCCCFLFVATYSFINKATRCVVIKATEFWFWKASGLKRAPFSNSTLWNEFCLPLEPGSDTSHRFVI